MSDISELERRLTAALDRISSGVANAKAAPAEDPAIAAAQIAELTATNAELSEKLSHLEARAQRLGDRLTDTESENARLEAVIEALREHSDALSAANIAAQSAEDAINAALASEVADMRAARKTDIAQMNEILAELAPAMKEA